MNANPRLSVKDIREVVGNIDDLKAAAIAEMAPSIEELEEAVAWAQGESDVMAELEQPSDAVVAALHDLLVSELPPEEERERPAP